MRYNRSCRLSRSNDVGIAQNVVDTDYVRLLIDVGDDHCDQPKVDGSALAA